MFNDFFYALATTENVIAKGGRSLGMSHIELRYNLATKVMRNGVEVIVATDRNQRPMEAEYLRHLSSTVTRPITLAPHTLTNLMSMVLPKDHADDGRQHLMSVLQPSFTTRTYYTTYNYPATISKGNMTAVSNVQTTVTNIRTEERSEDKSIQPTAAYSVTLSTSPVLHTDVFPTAYTYWNTFLDGDQPVVVSSTHTLSNTVVGAFATGSELEPSEVFPSTNTYLKTVGLTRTITDGTDFQVISTRDLVTQVVVTDKLVRKTTNLPVTTDVTKTYFVTYTYFSTYIDGDHTRVKSDVSVSSDVTIEKFYIKPKKTETKTIKQTSSAEVSTEFPTAAYPFSIFATQTYLTTFTYFTTLLQGPNSGSVETKVNSRAKVVENTVTKTIPLRDFHTDYLLRLNSSLNRITGALVATATLKGGEKVKVTAQRNAALSSSYLQYEIKPTKTLLNEMTVTETSHMEKLTQEHTKVKPTVSKSSFLLSKTKSTQLQKAKNKPSKTFIGEATVEALVATEEETTNSVSVTATATPAVTFTAASSSTSSASDADASDYSPIISSTSTLTPEEVTVTSNERIGEDLIGQPSEYPETDLSKKKTAVKPTNSHKNVTNLLSLNSLGINGMNVLGPVFDAMAELIHNNLNKNADSLSRRNDTVATVKEPEQPPRKPVSNNINPLLSFVNKFTPSPAKSTSEPKMKVTTPRAPVYIPVGSFAQDSEFGESQDSQVLASRPENWHDKWPDTHAKNFEKGRPHDPPITILEGGIPISPGQVITTNSDVIIGRPGETAPRPPTFAIKNNIPIDMKPPPLPSLAQFSQEDEDGFVAQHSMNQGVDLSISQEELGINPPRPPLTPSKKRPHQPHKNLRPHPNDRFRGSLKHKNPHSDYDSGAADLNPPPVPPPPVRSHDVHQPITINHEQEVSSDSHKIPNQILPIPVHLGSNQNIKNYINPPEISPAVLAIPAFPGHVNPEEIPPTLSEPTPNINAVNPNILLVPTVAQVPLNLYATVNSNTVDRSTGQQLLVKIQPSQVANIVIPHGSSTALILSEAKQHSLKGEVIDDPSPHPEPETVGFIGAEPVLKIENEDIAGSFHNGVIPAEAGEVAQQSIQDNQVVHSNRPHLTTELIKIRPKPVLDGSKGREPYIPEQQPQHLFLGQQQSGQQLSLAVARPPITPNQDSFAGNHRQTEHSQKNEADIHLQVNPSHFEEQNKNLYYNLNLQGLRFPGDEQKEAQLIQNYRKEEANHLKEMAIHGEIYSSQNQQKFHNYLASTGGLSGDQNKYVPRPHPVRGGNGIYVDISPPGHLPPRPNTNLLHQSHPPEKQQQSTLKEHLLNHQSGMVHDVPLNGQVQLGLSYKKENPLKEILISANTNKYDYIHDPKKKSTDTKFIQNQTQVKRPYSEPPDNLSPPPLKENIFRTHRPHPLISPHQGTAVQKYPLHPPVPKPADFMMPPPQVLHRPVHNPRPEYPPRPIIPIGAGGSQHTYPNPHPDDILIVPHKNRQESSTFNYVNNINKDFKQTTIPSDLDLSDSNDPVKTEYGEEIQESISRPLFPGQLPAELQKLNTSYYGSIHNHKIADDADHANVETVENTKLKDSSSAIRIPGLKQTATTSGSSGGAATNQFYKQKPNAESTVSHRPFFSLIKKPSGFVSSNQGANHKETLSFSNHKESSSLDNHKPQTFDPPDAPPVVKAPAKGGNIRIHAIGPAALPSGFVKNKNSVDNKRPPTKGLVSNELVQQPSSLNAVSSNKNKVDLKEELVGSPAVNAVNDQYPSTDTSSLIEKEKTVKPVTEDKETEDQTSEVQKSSGTNYPAIDSGGVIFPGRPQHNHQKENTTSSVSNQKFKTHGITAQTSKQPGAHTEETQGGSIQFHSNKVPTAYPIAGVHKNGSKKPQRHPVIGVPPVQTQKPSKRPSGFTTSGEKGTGFVSDDGIPSQVVEVKKPPISPIKIPAGFTYKNRSEISLPTVPNHNYGNKTLYFYESKPEFDVSEDVPPGKPPNEVDKWFSSNFGSGIAKLDINKKPSSKLPSAHRNVSSLPNNVLPADSDVHITLLPPPRGDGRPKPEDVMGLSPPPLERPRRPPRPKPPFKFEIPTTPKPTLPPIAVENDFPPVRSPDFNKKPLKPQDIFPPRLPDNFIHHLPEYSIRNHPPQRPVTSLPIDTPAESTTEKNLYSDSNRGKDTFLIGSEINGHSKPIAEDDLGFSTMKPPPPPSNNRGKPASPPKPSTVYQQPPTVRTTERIKQEVSNKQKTVPIEGISPTSTLGGIVKTTFQSKVSTSVTPTVGVIPLKEQPQKSWQPGDVISSSETVFDPDKFSSYITPSIHDFTTKRNIITTLISTGSTTIFGDLYTPAPKPVPADKKPVSTKVKDTAGAVDEEKVITPTKTAMHTTTLTVTTTMTTVVHSIGHKPFTKTIVLTKTLISTVFNKVTETKTLVKPTTATIIQTHTIATTKTALVVPTAFHPAPTKYPPGGTLKPEIFVADPHAKDTMTISVSSSMNKHGQDKRTGEDPSDYVFMSNSHPDGDGGVDMISHEEDDSSPKVLVGGVLDANSEIDSKEMNRAVECTPGCKAKKNELCQKIEGIMKCVCRPGFARMFPDRPCRPTYTYNVQLMLDKLGSEQTIHEKNFVQSASPGMGKLTVATKEGLDRMIMQSELRDIYHGIMVNGFQGKEKKTMVNFYVQLSENTDEAKLMEILKKTLRTSNYSLGGTELFADREANSLYAEDFNECLSSKFHDCSENARCFNLKGTYTCSCKEGFTDLSENAQFPGRVCSDTIGCEYCGYHGACYSKGEGQVTCECFQWYSGERCHINLKVLLIALVTIGAVLLALLMVCAVMACLNRSRESTASRTNGSGGYLRYRGPSNRSLDRRAMIADSSSESSLDNLPYVCAPPLTSTEALKTKKKPALRHTKGPAPRPMALPGMEQRDRSVTVMIPRAKYRPMPPLSPHLTMSTFSPDKHLSKTAAQIATEQKLISYLDGNSREDRTLAGTSQNNRQAKEQQNKTPSPNADGSPKPEQKKDSKIFEYEYKISNMLFTEETNSADKRSFKSLDDRFRRHSDSTHLNSDTSNRHQFRKYSAGALVSAGYEVSAKVGMHHLEEDTTEDEQSAIINTHTLKSTRSQFTTLNRTGDHKTMSEARSYDETTVHPPTRSLKTHYSGSSPSSRVNNDEGHTMIERDLGSTFIMPESQLFKPEADRGSDISNFDSL